MRKPLLKKLTLCSIYSALAIISFVIENLFPPLFLPGARMGVSNVFILICLITLGPKYAVISLILKTTLGSIISGNAFAIVYSLPSGLIALTVETLALYLMKKVSILATSIMGAVINTTFQNLTFCIITNTSQYLLKTNTTSTMQNYFQIRNSQNELKRNIYMRTYHVSLNFQKKSSATLKFNLKYKFEVQSMNSLLVK